MTQHDLLLKRLNRWTTALDALKDCGCMRLAARIQEFKREGIHIEDKWIEADGKRYKAYRIV